jgi:L-ascorbate metabolism protein UlaG (beta-lactamase superfamily)
MKLSILAIALVLFLTTSQPVRAGAMEVDRFPAGAGDLKITFIGHGTLMFEFDGKVIHVDPYGKLADYGLLPDADLILITHEHGDHLDMDAIKQIRKDSTIIMANAAAAAGIEGAMVMKNGDQKVIMGIPLEAVPAYNVVHKRDNGEPFHPPGRGNGYVLTLGSKRIYVAGDTENIAEMSSLGTVDIAFVPANLPYTMTPEMAADAARKIHPKVLYPYHYGDTDVKRIAELLSDTPEIEVRIRSMK